MEKLSYRRMRLLYLALVQTEAGDNQMLQVSALHSLIVLPLNDNKHSTLKSVHKQPSFKHTHILSLSLCVCVCVCVCVLTINKIAIKHKR